MCMRIGFTGAPFAGKTRTAQSASQRSDIIVIQEAAHLLYECGFPKPHDVGMTYIEWMRTFRGIYVPARIAIQRALEDSLRFQAEYSAKRAILCDRTIADSVVYYDSADQFLNVTGLALSDIHARYDHVLFFESPVIKRRRIPGYDRRMPLRLSRRAHRLLMDVYRTHPNVTYIPSSETIEQKFEYVAKILDRTIGEEIRV